MSRGQPRTRPGKPGFDSGFGYFERLSDLSDRIATHHPHLDDLTKSRLKIPDGSKHTSITLAVNADTLGAGAGVSEFKPSGRFFCFTGAVVRYFSAPTPPAKDHQRRVNRNPGDPAIEARSLFEGVERHVGLQEGVLQGIFGIFRIFSYGQKLPVDSLSIDLSQLGEGGGRP